jgi:hypothetical protein
MLKFLLSFYFKEDQYAFAQYRLPDEELSIGKFETILFIFYLEKKQFFLIQLDMHHWLI